MFKKMFLSVLLLLSSFSLLNAQNFAAGVILGEPTGLSFTVDQGRGGFWDFGLAYSLDKNDNLHFHVDRLWSSPLANENGMRTRLYYGIGGRLLSHEKGGGDDELRLALRAPLGLSFRFRRSPVELFVEGALLMDVVPSTETDFNAGVGLRYHF